MGRVKNLGSLIAAALIYACIIGGSAFAEEGEYNRSSHIASKGTIKYADGKVVISSSDLTYLANEIDDLERAYKSKTVEALNGIGTFYASAAGEISHYENDNNISSDNAAVLSFKDLYRGITESQSVDYLAAVQATDAGKNPMYYADGDASERGDLISVTTDANDFPLLIRSAAAGNLTAGTAAWVDGEVLIGTGADNQSYYNKGDSDGYDRGYGEGRTQGQDDVRDNPGDFGLTPVTVEELTYNLTLAKNCDDCGRGSHVFSLVGATRVDVTMKCGSADSNAFNTNTRHRPYASINGIVTPQLGDNINVQNYTWTRTDIGNATLGYVYGTESSIHKTDLTVTIHYGCHMQ